MRTAAPGGVDVNSTTPDTGPTGLGGGGGDTGAVVDRNGGGRDAGQRPVDHLDRERPGGLGVCLQVRLVDLHDVGAGARFDGGLDLLGRVRCRGRREQGRQKQENARGRSAWHGNLLRRRRR